MNPRARHDQREIGQVGCCCAHVTDGTAQRGATSASLSLPSANAMVLGGQYWPAFWGAANQAAGLRSRQIEGRAGLS